MGWKKTLHLKALQADFCCTSAGGCELRATNKPKVPGPSPEGLRGVAEAQAGVEMIGLKGFVVVDGVVATGRVGTVHPDLCGKREPVRATPPKPRECYSAPGSNCDKEVPSLTTIFQTQRCFVFSSSPNLRTPPADVLS